MTYFIQAAEVWQPDLSGKHLVLSSAHYGNFQVGDSKVFQEASRAMQFGINEGLPGKTWAERRPLIWTDLTLPHFKRNELAEIAGLACGLSIPVFAGEFLLGVVILFFAAGDEACGAVEVWQNRDYYDNELKLKGGYYGQLQDFEWVSKRLSILRGHGLPGQAWKTGKPLMMDNLGEQSNFLRASHAKTSGLTTGLAVPFFYTDRDIQVITFLSTLSTPLARRFEIWQPDEERRYLLFSDGFCAEQSDLKKQFRGTAYARGESTIGQVWLTGRPLAEAIDDANAERGIYFPYIANGVMKAVIGFIY